MNAEIITNVVISVLGFLSATLVPSLILLVKKWKQAKAATTEAERQKALNEASEVATNLIQEAETTYKQIDDILHQRNGSGSGTLKKESVMAKLQTYCNDKGIPFDKDYWSNKVDSIVAMTKNVNKN